MSGLSGGRQSLITGMDRTRAFMHALRQRLESPEMNGECGNVWVTLHPNSNPNSFPGRPVLCRFDFPFGPQSRENMLDPHPLAVGGVECRAWRAWQSFLVARDNATCAAYACADEMGISVGTHAGEVVTFEGGSTSKDSGADDDRHHVALHIAPRYAAADVRPLSINATAAEVTQAAVALRSDNRGGVGGGGGGVGGSGGAGVVPEPPLDGSATTGPRRGARLSAGAETPAPATIAAINSTAMLPSEARSFGGVGRGGGGGGDVRGGGGDGGAADVAAASGGMGGIGFPHEGMARESPSIEESGAADAVVAAAAAAAVAPPPTSRVDPDMVEVTLGDDLGGVDESFDGDTASSMTPAGKKS